ncbi:MAG TPA: endonuclease domain-containing protein [Byssovorax sp.]
MSARIDGRKLELARRFRSAPTAAETQAWALLRNRGVLGLKFRRQQIIAGFIVDFYCASHRLALELDGTVHDAQAQAEHDAERNAALQRMRVRTVRLRDEDLCLDRLIEVLAAAIDLPPRPCGRPSGRHDRSAGRSAQGEPRRSSARRSAPSRSEPTQPLGEP